jgi:hypothetical protein
MIREKAPTAASGNLVLVVLPSLTLLIGRQFVRLPGEYGNPPDKG